MIFGKVLVCKFRVQHVFLIRAFATIDWILNQG